MMDEASRLRTAREAAGFETAAAACDRFGWKYPTYSAHENGSRGLRGVAVIRYAKAFKVEPAWLLTGTMPTPIDPLKAQSMPGFSESEVVIFESGGGDMQSRMADVAQRGIKKSISYVAQRDCTHFSIISGDVLVLDTAATANDGETCIVQIVDTQLVSAETVVAQVMAGKPVPSPFRPSVMAPSVEFSIIGVIRAVIRVGDQPSEKKK